MDEIAEAVAVLQETLQGELERCGRCIRAGDTAVASQELETAMAKLSGVTDMLRAARTGGWD